MEQLIEDLDELYKIERGDSFVKKWPQNLGHITYFYTDNNQANPRSFIYYFSKRIISFLITVSIIIAAYYFFVEYLEFNVFGYIVCGIVALIGFFITIDIGFSGSDYFFCENGYAIYSFTNNRNNIKSLEVNFSDFNYFLHIEENIFDDNKYEKTKFIFVPIKKVDNSYSKIHKLYGEFDLKNEKEVENNLMYNYISLIEKKKINELYKSVFNKLDIADAVDFPIFDKQIEQLDKIRIYKNGDIAFNDMYFYSVSDEDKKLDHIIITGEGLIICYIDNKAHNYHNTYKEIAISYNYIANYAILLCIIYKLADKKVITIKFDEGYERINSYITNFIKYNDSYGSE